MKLFFLAAFFLNAALYSADVPTDLPAIIDAIERGTLRHKPQTLVDALLPYAENRHHLLARGYLWLFRHYPKVFFKVKYHPCVKVVEIVDEFERHMGISPTNINPPHKVLPHQILNFDGATLTNSLGRKLIAHYLEPAFSINQFYQGFNIQIFPTPTETQGILTLLTNCYVNKSGESFNILRKILYSSRNDYRLSSARQYLAEVQNYQEMLTYIEEQTYPERRDFKREELKTVEGLLNVLWSGPLKKTLSNLDLDSYQPFTDGTYEYILATERSLPEYQKEYFIITSLALGNPLALGIKLLEGVNEYPDHYLEFLYDGVGPAIVDLLPNDGKNILILAKMLKRINRDKASALLLRLHQELSHFMFERMQRNPQGYCGIFNYRRNRRLL